MLAPISTMVIARKYSPTPATPISLASRMLNRKESPSPASCMAKAVATRRGRPRKKKAERLIATLSAVAVPGIGETGSARPGRGLIGNGEKVAPVFRLAELQAKPPQVVAGDEPLAKGDLLGAAYPEALTLFQRSHELRRVQHGIRRAGVEPCEAAAQALDPQFAHPQIRGHRIRDFQFAARRRF